MTYTDSDPQLSDHRFNMSDVVLIPPPMPLSPHATQLLCMPFVAGISPRLDSTYRRHIKPLRTCYQLSSADSRLADVTPCRSPRCIASCVASDVGRDPNPGIANLPSSSAWVHMAFASPIAVFLFSPESLQCACFLCLSLPF